MQKVRQTLLQFGGIILCVNGALWFMSSVRDAGPMTFGQLLFRIGVFLLGLLFVGAAGVLALIEKFQAPESPESRTGRREIDEGELMIEQSTNSHEDPHD